MADHLISKKVECNAIIIATRNGTAQPGVVGLGSIKVCTGNSKMEYVVRISHGQDIVNVSA